MNAWIDLLTADQLASRHADTAKLDPRFARTNREWYEARTAAELRAQITRSWNCNDSEGYQLARSYLNLKGAQQ